MRSQGLSTRWAYTAKKLKLKQDNKKTNEQMEGNENSFIFHAVSRGNRNQIRRLRGPLRGYMDVLVFWPFPSAAGFNGKCVVVRVTLFNALKKNPISHVKPFRWALGVVHLRRSRTLSTDLVRDEVIQTCSASVSTVGINPVQNYTICTSLMEPKVRLPN